MGVAPSIVAPSIVAPSIVALPIVALLAGLARADPPDAGPPSEPPGEEADAQSGAVQTDAGVVAAPARIDPIVRRLVSRAADHESCRVLPPVHGEERYLCTITECPGACQVVHVEVTIGVRRGRGRVLSRTPHRVGDTGECGCCMELGF